MTKHFFDLKLTRKKINNINLKKLRPSNNKAIIF